MMKVKYFLIIIILPVASNVDLFSINYKFEEPCINKELYGAQYAIGIDYARFFKARRSYQTEKRQQIFNSLKNPSKCALLDGKCLDHGIFPRTAQPQPKMQLIGNANQKNNASAPNSTIQEQLIFKEIESKINDLEQLLIFSNQKTSEESEQNILIIQSINELLGKHEKLKKQDRTSKTKQTVISCIFYIISIGSTALFTYKLTETIKNNEINRLKIAHNNHVWQLLKQMSSIITEYNKIT